MVFEMIACLLMAVGIVKGVENMDKELEETMYYTAQEGDTVERIAGGSTCGHVIGFIS